MPTCATYTPTKWAGEAFSDILRRELYRFGVKAIIIEPGNFGGLTGMLNRDNVSMFKHIKIKCVLTVSLITDTRVVQKVLSLIGFLGFIPGIF